VATGAAKKTVQLTILLTIQEMVVVVLDKVLLVTQVVVVTAALVVLELHTV
jgi:hypothetical protein